MDCLHSRLYRLVSDSHLVGKEITMQAHIDRLGWLEAALLALRAACGAAACPGRRALWNCEHALAKSRMRSCMDDRLCICPYGVAMSPGPRVLDSTHRKLPPMYNP